MGDTQRGSQSYMKRRERREIEVTRRRGGIKRGEGNLASNQFPICSPQSGKLRERFTEFHREEKREEGDRGDQEERRGSQKERDQYNL